MSWRRWERAAKLYGKTRRPVEKITKWNIVRGDLVQILAGKDKGKQGKVNQVIRVRNSVMVEGLNTHIRILPKTENFKGGRIQSEAPLHVSNVALVDPSDNLPCRVKYMYTEEGQKVRISRRTGTVVPKPPELKDRKDFKSRATYIEGELDTKAEAVTKVTYIPSLNSFENDVLISLGREDEIKENKCSEL